MIRKISILLLILTFAIVLTSPVSGIAVPTTSCPQSCSGDDRLVVVVYCQHRRIVKGPEEENCCLYTCVGKNSNSNTDYSSIVINQLGIDPFNTTIKFTTAQGIASLFTTLLQMFLGVVAIYSVIVAVRSAILLANPENSDAFVVAKKNLGTAIIGIVICSMALLFLSYMVNLLGLGTVDQVFRSLAAFINAGRT